MLVTRECGCIYPKDRGHDPPALRNNHCLLGDPENSLCSLPHPLFSFPCTHTELMMLGVHHMIGVAFILATDNLTAQRGGQAPSAGESMDGNHCSVGQPFHILASCESDSADLRPLLSQLHASASPPGVQLGIMFWVSVFIRIIIYGSLDSHRICATWFSHSLSFNPLNRVRQVGLYNPHCSDSAPLGHLPPLGVLGMEIRGWDGVSNLGMRTREAQNWVLLSAAHLLWFPINLATLTGANMQTFKKRCQKSFEFEMLNVMIILLEVLLRWPLIVTK